MANKALNEFLGNIPDRVDPDPAPVVCENCGKLVLRRDLAINCMVAVGSPGHPDIPSFQCPHEEHWACSIECWAIVADKCVVDHILPILRMLHTQVIPNLDKIV